MINTIKGTLDEAALARTVIFEDRPKEFVIAVEWRLGDELVRRDCHVTLKDPTVTSDAQAGGFGG